MEKNIKININEFIKQYNTLKNEDLKKVQIAKVIKRRYVPVLEKKIILDVMLQKSIITDENGKQYIDMFLHKLNIISAIIILYTNIEIDKNNKENSSTTDMYDLFVKNNILDMIYEQIGNKELQELMSINKLVLDTWHNQNSTAEAYLTRLFNTVSKNIGATIGIGISKLADVLSDENKSDNLILKLENIINKLA